MSTIATTRPSTEAAPTGPPSRDRKRRRRREALPLYLAISPFYVLFAVFGLFPIVFSIVLSFTD